MAANESTMVTLVEDSELMPELLECSRLVLILQKRCVKTKRDVQTLTKDELIALFRKYVASLSQRKWRENRRGRLMNKYVLNDDNEAPSHNTQRLKQPQIPPLQAADFSRKVIKLKNNTTKDIRMTDQKRKIDYITTKYDEPANKLRKITWP